MPTEQQCSMYILHTHTVGLQYSAWACVCVRERVHISAYLCIFSVVFVANVDALMTGVGGSHIYIYAFSRRFLSKTTYSGYTFFVSISAPCIYKAMWLPHSNSDAVCFPWWVWTKPKPGTVWLWMEHYYLWWQCFMWSPLPLSSGIKMCNKHLQQKKRNGNWKQLLVLVFVILILLTIIMKFLW